MLRCLWLQSPGVPVYCVANVLSWQQRNFLRCCCVVQVWHDDGHYDDLLLQGYCAGQTLSTGLPVTAMMPQIVLLLLICPGLA